jgi:hypothetical protein
MKRQRKKSKEFYNQSYLRLFKVIDDIGISCRIKYLQ